MPTILKVQYDLFHTSTLIITFKHTICQGSLTICIDLQTETDHNGEHFDSVRLLWLLHLANVTTVRQGLFGGR